ncbi:MAG TPA: hypothetical protein VFA21_20155 [Pyrinomonadaceae bacterium]|jgi:hypothetical protein|nr:hypothetical protein [Pyrinomonadaceae bacterium]
MLKTSILFFSIFLALAGVARAQDEADAQDSRPGAHRGRDDMGKPAEEIIARAEIRHQEETHKEMVDRAGEAAQIGGEILDDYKKNNALSGDDFKKLERLDKLAHKIRGTAGGSEDVDLEDPPSKLDDAVKRLADASDLLNKSVQKTSRMVISAAVINHSNELINLIKRIRDIQHP